MAESSPLLEQAWAQVYLDASQALALVRQCAATLCYRPGPGWLIQALVEVKLGQADAAGTSLAQARERLARPADARHLDLCDEVQAILLRGAGDYEAAARLQREIDARPDPGYKAIDQFVRCNSRAITQKVLGHYDEALRQFYLALRAADETGLAGPRVTALCNLGAHHHDLFNHEDSRVLMEQALQQAREAGAKQIVRTSASNLIVIYHAAGLPGDARAMAEFLLRNPQELAPGALEKTLRTLALGHLSVGDFEAAESFLNRRNSNNQSNGDGEVFEAWMRARCLLARGDPQGARALCEDTLHAREQCSRADLPYHLMELHRAAADACEQRGDTAAALAFVRRAYGLYEQLVGRSARARFRALQASHEMVQAQHERDIARNSQRSAEEDRRRLSELNEALLQKAAETEMLHAQLREQALRDPLTGLHNRRYLFEMAPGLLELSRRQSSPLCVVLIDLDHFKSLNDTYGHDTGDAVLKRFAALLVQMLRRSDVVIRYGGEEFVAVMPDVGPAGAQLMLSRLLEAYQGKQQEIDHPGLPRCSFSAGIAQFLMHGDTLEQLLSRADSALYAAKNLGRARIEQAAATDLATSPVDQDHP